MKRTMLATASAAAVVLCAVVHAQQVTVQVDMKREFQTMSGLGDMVTTDAAMYSDLGISSVRFGWDPEYDRNLEWTNDNSDPAVLDLSAFRHTQSDIDGAKAAYNAGVREFIITVWSPPLWMKSFAQHAYSNQQQWQCPALPKLCGGFLMPSMYDEFTEWVVGSIKSFHAATGFYPTAFGPQNELEFPEPYGSCVYEPAEINEVAKRVGRRLEKEGIPTKLFLPEALTQQGNVGRFLQAVNSDTETTRYVRAFAIHDYDQSGITPASTSKSWWQRIEAEARRVAPRKEVWMTETSGWESQGLRGGVLYGAAIHNALRYGNASNWNYFFYSRGNKVYAVAKNFTKYIRPGAVRVGDTVSGTTDMGAVVFKHAANQNVTIVLVNTSTSNSYAVSITGAGLPQSAQRYTTDASRDCAADGSVTLAGGTLSLPVAANSVTTLTGSAEVSLRSGPVPGRKPSWEVQMRGTTGHRRIGAEAGSAGTLCLFDPLGRQAQRVSLVPGRTTEVAGSACGVYWGRWNGNNGEGGTQPIVFP